MKDAVILQAFKMLPDFGPHARLAWEYAELFRLGPPFNARKLVRVLGEVREFFHGGAFEYQKRKYEISRDGLAAAIRVVCNAQIKGGLQNHNYLKKCAIRIAEEESAERSKIEEGKRRKEEKAKMEPQPSTASGQGISQIQNVPEKVKDLLKGIGG